MAESEHRGSNRRDLYRFGDAHVVGGVVCALLLGFIAWTWGKFAAELVAFVLVIVGLIAVLSNRRFAFRRLLVITAGLASLNLVTFGHTGSMSIRTYNTVNGVLDGRMFGSVCVGNIAALVSRLRSNEQRSRRPPDV